jgi:hypothetical protein
MPKKCKSCKHSRKFETMDFTPIKKSNNYYCSLTNKCILNANKCPEWCPEKNKIKGETI